jgi:limonene 1,2-monooxygenase
VPTGLRFGVFVAPFHNPRSNPTLNIRRDIELTQHLERLGFDEAWFGEHHSGGTEIIASPELMIATVAQMTRRIKLGTGVLSIPYHHPLMAADRMNFLDHLTEGRALFGVGPGALPSDAWMMGIDPADQRRRLREGLDAVLRLLRGESVTMETDWFTLRDASLQLRPYTDPHIEMTVASVASPTGAQLAGQHGIGMLSIGTTTNEGVAHLANHWEIVEDEAGKSGRPVSRSNWRLLGVMHLAETKEQAVEDMRYGIEHFWDYFKYTAAFPQFQFGGDTFEERIAYLDEVGIGAIGTPAEAVAQIKRLQELTGGFGTYLLQTHNLANPEATWRSYELFSQYVIPEFQGGFTWQLRSEKAAQDVRATMYEAQRLAVERETQRYQAEKGQ